MSDRYLYRAKRTDNGKTIEGYLVNQYGSTKIYLPDGADGEYGFDCYEIDPSTICQCTGLKDKNGKLIWENDIVSFAHSKITSKSLAKELGFPDFEKEGYKRNYVIEFVNTYCTYGLRFRNKSIHFPCKASTIWMHDCIVIGNIFDNPELLE